MGSSDRVVPRNEGVDQGEQNRPTSPRHKQPLHVHIEGPSRDAQQKTKMEAQVDPELLQLVLTNVLGSCDEPYVEANVED